ncbi:MAG: RloB domain-containing protein [Aureispira sp.]
MGSRKKNRRSGRKSLKKGKQVIEEHKEVIGEGSFDKRTAGNLSLLKNILIVCEGETEAAYFFALKKFLDHKLIIGVEILPDLDTQDKKRGSEGSALSKLLEVALEKMREKDYAEVWVVMDNDEDNAYKLDNHSIDRIKYEDPISSKILKTNQVKALNVRVDEEKKERIHYFLHRSEYEDFLRNLLPDLTAVEISRIIKLTTKKEIFEQFEADRTDFFEKKHKTSLDKKEQENLARIKIAFSAISFEHWLLLHYEYNATAFYNSREYLPYFDENNYLKHSKNGHEKPFKRGYLLYEEENQFKAFFEHAEKTAIPNALFLQNSYVAPQIGQGLSYYEINPYCDVFYLVGSLINTEFLKLGTVYQIKTNNDPKKNLLKNLSLIKNETRLSLSFQLVYKQSLFDRNIEAVLSFVVYPQNGTVRNFVPQNIQYNSKIYRKDDLVEIEFDLASFQQRENCCLYFNLKELYPNKGKQLCYTFVV